MVAMKDPSGTALAVGRLGGWEPLGFEAGDDNWYRFVANGPTGATDSSGLISRQRGAPIDVGHLGRFRVLWTRITLDGFSNKPGHTTPCKIVLIQHIRFTYQDNVEKRKNSVEYFEELGQITKGENSLLIADAWRYRGAPPTARQLTAIDMTVTGVVSAYEDTPELRAVIDSWEKGRAYKLGGDDVSSGNYRSSPAFDASRYNLIESEKPATVVQATWLKGKMTRVHIQKGDGPAPP